MRESLLRYVLRACAAAVLLLPASCTGSGPEEQEAADQASREAAFLRGGTAAAEADAAWAAGEREDAAALYEEAVGLRPSVSVNAYRRIAEVRGAAGDLEAACAWLERGRTAFPGDVALLKSLGTLREKQGRAAAALECYEAVLRRRPADPEATNGIERTRKALRTSP
jgi:tetratricopeptide (TPR) repeat protein